jgi:hypothetical protein
MHPWKLGLFDNGGRSLEFIATPQARLEWPSVLIDSERVQGYVYERGKLDIVKFKLLTVQPPETLEGDAHRPNRVK